ncbi:melanocyte-stimulating hormone receptor-like [Oculina patagonica]
MENFTGIGNSTKSLCTTGLNGTRLKIFIIVLNSIQAMTAFLGNVLIIVALQKVSSLHPPSKRLLGCLASTDLCVGLIAQPFYVAFLTSPEHSERCHYLYILFNSISVIFGGVSLFTLTAISVDRLLALLLGLRYRQVVTLRKVQVFIIVSWLSSFAIAMIFFFNFHITISIICILMLLCVIISSLCYTKIYLTLRHHQAQLQDCMRNDQRQPNGGGVPLNIARYRKTVSSALWVQITLVACYLPYTIVAILGITRVRTGLLNLAWEAAISLVMLNSTLNPFLYCWKMREIRQEVNSTIRQFWCSSS